MDKIYTILLTLSMPVAYRAFPDDSDVDLPILLFDMISQNVFYADGGAYYITSRFVIALQERYRSETTESNLRNAFASAGISISDPRIEYVDGEDFYEYTFEVEV